MSLSYRNLTAILAIALVVAVSVILQAFKVIDILANLTDLWIWIAAAILGSAFALLTSRFKIADGDKAQEPSAPYPRPLGLEILTREQLDRARSFKEYLLSAKSALFLSAINGGGFMHQSDTFKELLRRKDFRITILVVRRDPTMMQLNERTFDSPGVEGVWKGALATFNGIKTDKELGEDERNRFLIKTHDLLPLESMVIIDPESEDGKMQVETYVYGKATPSRPNIALTKRDQRDLFEVYWESYEWALRKSKPFDPADLS